MQDADPESESILPGIAESYTTASTTRNVCFVQLDGRRIFLNYSYLVSGGYVPEENRITLAFTSHTVTIDGIHLEKLFEGFMAHISRYVVCIDPRYNAISESEKPTINKILVVSTT